MHLRKWLVKMMQAFLSDIFNWFTSREPKYSHSNKISQQSVGQIPWNKLSLMGSLKNHQLHY